MQVLFVGAHPDDVELGCLGAMFHHIKNNDSIHYLLASDGYVKLNGENRLDEHKKVVDLFDKINVIKLHLPDTRLYNIENREQIRKELEALRDAAGIDLVYCHWMNDIHQDHQTLAEECVRVFRDITLLQYEITYSCPGFNGNYFIDLSEEDLEKKIKILSMFESQNKERYFHEDHLRSIMHWHGYQAGLSYAEAFDVWKIIVKPGA